jgi:hypothetical protein
MGLVDMAYYVMVDDKGSNEQGEALFEIYNCFKIGTIMSWRGGRLITEYVPTPIKIDYEPYRGFSGPPADLWDVCLPLMSTRLVDALAEAGVNNLQLYPAILTNTQTKETYDYYVFNVVGKIAASDMKKSDTESFDGQLTDTSFFSLSIDEQKALSLLMFRIAENINALMVHERVRDYVVSKGIPQARFVKPENWAQL